MESLILLHNLSLFLNPWRNVKEEKEMNKIETMKRKEIIENLKYVEKISIAVKVKYTAMSNSNILLIF